MQTGEAGTKIVDFQFTEVATEVTASEIVITEDVGTEDVCSEVKTSEVGTEVDAAKSTKSMASSFESIIVAWRFLN